MNSHLSLSGKEIPLENHLDNASEFSGDIIIDYLINHSITSPDKSAFIFLEDGEDLEKCISFSELNLRVEHLAFQFLDQQLEGKRALLVYKDTLEFTISFLACQYAGVIAVPVFFAKGNKQISRLINLMEDAQVSVILSTSNLKDQVKQALSVYTESKGIEIIATETICLSERNVQKDKSSVQNDNKIAFIQYTSGSTGKPKGVVISGKNLIHNQQFIQLQFSLVGEIGNIGLKKYS